MKILFVGGGSVGHLAPLVAVWREVQVMQPNAEALFICTDKQADSDYLTAEHVPFERITPPRLSALLPIRFVTSYRRSRDLIQSFNPDIVFSKGGAVSVPVCMAARVRDIPIVLHESDAVMGRANRFLSRWAIASCCGFDMTHAKPKVHNFVLTGNPIRPSVMKGELNKGLALTGLSGKRPILFVWGGSQGAQALNDAVRNQIDAILALCDVVHITGPWKKGADARAGYFSTEMAYDNLPHLQKIATVALSRSGAGSIGELAANGTPMILVPLTGLAQDHQQKNADAAAASGGAIVLPQGQLLADLIPTLKRFLEKPSVLTEMSQKALALAQPEAARRIAEIILGSIA